ncbi:MAG: inorganic polyphosphate/ATP-NAD kinase [Verrucomicrobiales bacterium]|nr:inorganic polyphosphate/ATP-NAD kinase [Verrucomicrobiales bacterium]
MEHPVIGIVANPTKSEAAHHVRSLQDAFTAQGAKVILEEAAAGLLGAPEPLSLKELAAGADVIVVLGGDGTILRTARLLGASVKPLAAVNTGHLGFLTTSTEREIPRFVTAVLSGDYRLSHRGLVQAEFTDKDGTCYVEGGMNEVTVTRGTFSRLIHLEVKVNGDFLNRYSGDGLIISTPTGSTAYSLSAGGPIINPEAGVFCLTPICPHALSNRSFVVNDNITLEILPVDPVDEVLLNVDGGNAWSLARHQPVILRKAPWTVPLIAFREDSFYEVLRDKLKWSGSSI